MSRKLDDLSQKMRSCVVEFLARCVEAGIPILILDTLRTKEEQIENIKKGVSWTLKSKHLPDENGKANAIDICPYSVFELHGPDKLQWDSSDLVWTKLGALGEAAGLKWGVVMNGKRKDLGHFELPKENI